MELFGAHLPAGTSFSHPVKTVDLLRAAAGYLLMNSDDFVAGMKRLDLFWKPRQIIIAPALFDEGTV